MYEWNEVTQKMIDWIEENITEEPSLLKMSREVGYSPYYCSTQFHKICGMTIKSYISGRRLALAALEIRGTSRKIIDVAVKYGFSSQEALTRAFRAALGCTPAAYRKNPFPVPLPQRKVIYFPEHYQILHSKGEMSMSETALTQARVRVEYIPAHRYIGIWEERARNYGDFWEYHDCDEVCGIIESMRSIAHPIVSSHTAGWYKTEDGRRYFYGFGVPEDYDGIVPKGFEIRDFPASYYLVFYHPPFDYMKDNSEVMGRVEKLAWNYDLAKERAAWSAPDYQNGGNRFEWNEDACQCYQRHYPEGIGYEILRPVRLKRK